MKIALCCNDTRGGVEPYAILGAELRSQGHEVTLIAPVDFAPMAAKEGLHFKGLSGSQAEVANIAASISGKGPLTALRVTLREMSTRVAGWSREMCEGAEGADLLVGGIGGMITGVPVAERLGVPFVEAHLQPLGVRSPQMNGVLFGALPGWAGPYARLLSQVASDALVRAQFGPAGRIARKALGGARKATHSPHRTRIYGFSPRVVPDTGRFGVATGYWHRRESEWLPTPELAQFIDSPKPVIVIGFGSIASSDPERMLRLVTETAERGNCRVVYLSGWTRQNDRFAHADVLMLKDVPHSWLFPRVRAVVHHGGAGTTGAGFAAGVPQVIVPFGVDQPFWASRVNALGVGPAALPKRRLDAALLTDTLAGVLAGTYRTRAIELAEQLASETGVQTAAKQIVR